MAGVDDLGLADAAKFVGISCVATNGELESAKKRELRKCSGLPVNIDSFFNL